jgi:hypothetical protein
MRHRDCSSLWLFASLAAQVLFVAGCGSEPQPQASAAEPPPAASTPPAARATPAAAVPVTTPKQVTGVGVTHG